MIADTRSGRALRLAAAAAVALLVTVVCLIGATPARADLAIDQFSTTFHDPAGNPVTQAGAHSEFTTDFDFSTVTNPLGALLPSEQLREAVFDLPAGLYGNPQAVPACTPADYGSHFGVCPVSSQVGYMKLQFNAPPAPTFDLPVFNIEPRENELAAFATAVFGVPVHIRISLREDYRLRATITNVNQATTVFGATLTLWGVPADPVHTPERNNQEPSTAPLRPFMAAPANCEGPLVTTMRVRTWQQPDKWIERTAESPARTGCDKLKFDGDMSFTPETSQADAPSGYRVKLEIPQEESINGLATPQLRKTTVTLPEGVSISPGSANGLEACTDGQLALNSEADPSCSLASKIGEVKVTTPVLEEPLEGDIVVRSPEPGNLFRIALIARGPGVVIKLPGTINTNKTTGQITAVFDNTPQLPFSELDLVFKGGPRAPLANPRTCGAQTVQSELVSWGGQTATSTSGFNITGCNGGFAPTFEAGTVNPLAGAFSPFTMTIRRPDGHQDIAGLALDMPNGLLGSIRGIPQCPEAQAAAGTCGEASRIGTTTVEAGPGSMPFPLQGKVFLGGPYKGAPFSLSVAVHALAGPYDLGMVVVRAPIFVDAANAKLAVPSDPLPTILEGVPLRLRTINITMDRPGFTFNATNCTPMQIGARITSTGGAVASPAVPYQAQGCAGLPLKPSLALTLEGKKETTDGKHPGIRATLTQGRGESGLKKVAVKLPLSLALDPDNAQALCKPEQAAARACPAGSIIGRASAVTPALNEPLTGPIYFVENTRRTASGNIRRTYPKLWLALKGEVPLDLYAQSDVDDDHLVTTFDMIPDAPISRFDLSITGGKNGVIVANTDICQKRQVTGVTFDGQSGKRVRSNVRMELPCGFKVAKRTAKGSSYELTLSGLKAGKVTVSGDGIESASRTVKRSSVARIMASPTDETRAAVRRNGKVSRKVTVTFTPSGSKKSQKTTTTLTFRR